MAVDEVCTSFCAQVSSLTPTLKLPSKNKAKHILYNIHIKWAEVEFQQILIRTRVIHAKKGVNTSNLGSLFGMLDGRKMFWIAIFFGARTILLSPKTVGFTIIWLSGIPRGLPWQIGSVKCHRLKISVLGCGNCSILS